MEGTPEARSWGSGTALAKGDAAAFSLFDLLLSSCTCGVLHSPGELGWVRVRLRVQGSHRGLSWWEVDISASASLPSQGNTRCSGTVRAAHAAAVPGSSLLLLTRPDGKKYRCQLQHQEPFNQLSCRSSA